MFSSYFLDIISIYNLCYKLSKAKYTISMILEMNWIFQLKSKERARLKPAIEREDLPGIT